MDLGFTRLEPASAEAIPAPLDYVRLRATLSAMQTASRTAMIEARLSDEAFSETRPVPALVELFTAGPEWIAAAAALGGCFHPAIAAGKRRSWP